MKYLKIIIGSLLALSGLVQLLKVIGIYLSQPADQWPVGAELGTLAVLVVGVLLVRSGLRHRKG